MPPPINKIDVAKLPSNPSAGDWVCLASLNESLIDKEHNLTNHRMAWQMSTQAFLFGSFCVILFNAPKDHRTASMLLNLIPAFGVFVAIAGGLGILAAQTVVQVLENERSVYRNVLSTIFNYPQMPELGLSRAGWLSWTRFGGIWPPRLIILTVGSLWLLVLLGRFGITFGFVDRGF